MLNPKGKWGPGKPSQKPGPPNPRSEGKAQNLGMAYLILRSTISSTTAIPEQTKQIRQIATAIQIMSLPHESK
jgi:hypothetical protein